MGATQEFTSGYGRALTVAATGAGLVALVTTTFRYGAGDALRVLPVVALGALVVWALFWRPSVEVSDGEVVVRNVRSTVHVPWPTYRGVTAGWSLVVHTTDGDVEAFAAPRASGTLQRLRRPDEAPPPAVVPADGPTVRDRHATAESVAAAVEARHDTLVRAGHLDRAEQLRVQHGLRTTRHVHTATIAATVVLAALAAAVLVTA